ncbi:MAG: hypothetical protein HRT35_20620 [Algicola sp.]|nr:hypothetical protein [Algicola sp.]
MDINSGFKVIDKLARTHGVSCDGIDNPFQMAVEIPNDTKTSELRRYIQPFGLRTFPHAIWLALQANLPKGVGLSVHRFSLPHLGRVFCWVLVNAQGEVVEKAIPMNKPKYAQAARVLIESLMVDVTYH